jgi:hypothetical protein
VVVDRRADRPEVLCRSLVEASALAAQMNRQAISSGRANRTVPERRGDGGRDETISSETRDTRLDRV